MIKKQTNEKMTGLTTNCLSTAIDGGIDMVKF